MSLRKLFAALVCLAVIPAVSASPSFGPKRGYEVTVTNITHNLRFTPFLVAAHKPDVALFEVGEPASEELATLAEGGDTAPLAELLKADKGVLEVNTSDGLLEPGESVTVRINTHGGFNRISLAAMMLPTNDSFVALDGVLAPWGGIGGTHTAVAYDAGSEPNDELCASIPGPTCGGVGASPQADGEGFVHISRGIHGGGDLAPQDYDWRNPIAHISIERAGR